MSITHEAQKLTRSVYASVAILRQYPGPDTTRRYAEIPGVGLYSWSLGSAAVDDGVSVIRSTAGGSAGAWLLTTDIASTAAAVTALDARVDALEDNARPYAPRPAVISVACDPSSLDELTVTYDLAVTHASLAGLTLPGTGVTISGVVSGDTTTTVVYQLSGDLDPEDDADALFTVAATNGIRSAFDAHGDDGTTAIVFGLPQAPRTFWIGGQSNGAAAPPNNPGFSALTRYLGTKTGTRPDIFAWDDITRAMVPVVDGACNFRCNTGGVGTGPGPGLGQVFTPLARHFSFTLNEPVYAFGHCYTSQAISYFLPNSATRAYYTDGTQHATLNWFDLCVQEIQFHIANGGNAPEVFYFFQGEANANMSQADYYTALSTLRAAIKALFPAIHFVIVMTIRADADSGGGTTVTGVRAAQTQLESTFSDTHTVDCWNVRNATAYYGLDATIGQHYTSYAGYEHVFKCIVALHEDIAQPTVDTSLMHLRDVAAFTHLWGYGQSINVSSQIVFWQNDITGPKTLQTIGGKGVAVHVNFDPAGVLFAGRSYADFVRAESDAMESTGDIVLSGSNYTIAWFGKLDDATDGQYMASVFDLGGAGTGERFGLRVLSNDASNRLQAEYGGAFVNSAGPIIDTTAEHLHLVSFDGATNQVKWSVDGGAQRITSYGVTDEAPDSFVFTLMGSILGNANCDGKVALAALGAVVLDDTQCAAIQAWRAVEFPAVPVTDNAQWAA